MWFWLDFDVWSCAVWQRHWQVLVSCKVWDVIGAWFDGEREGVGWETVTFDVSEEYFEGSENATWITITAVMYCIYLLYSMLYVAQIHSMIYNVPCLYGTCRACDVTLLWLEPFQHTIPVHWLWFLVFFDVNPPPPVVYPVPPCAHWQGGVRNG